MSDDVEAMRALTPSQVWSASSGAPAADLLRDIFDATPVGLMALDVTGHIQRVNRSLMKLTGRRRDEWEGLLVFESLEVDDGLRLRERLSHHLGDVDVGMELELLYGDSQRLRCVVHLSRMMDTHCDPTGWILSWTPLLAPQSSAGDSRLFEVTLNAIEDCVSVVDAQGVFRMVNDAWCRRHRMARVQVIGRYVRDVFPTIDLINAMPALRECLQDRRATRAFLEMVHSPVGGQRIRLDFYPFGDDAGEVPQVVIVERIESRLALVAA
jgi:PAS domain S-box-containing protein